MSSGRIDHIPVISVGREGAPLALWVPPLGMTKDDMRPVLEWLRAERTYMRAHRA